MSIAPINIGSASNDGNGQDLRSGGQVINANFAELDQRTTAAQSAADAAQAKADTAQAKADAAIPSLQKGQPNGVAGLDGSGTVPASQLPSYVDDVLEFGSFATLPAAGETGKIYITTDTNSQYRWSGTQYVLLTASPGSTDAVPEGAVNKYWTLARTLGSALAGLVTTNPAVIAATDTVLAAFGKLQRQITDLTTLVANKAANGDNNDITSLRALTVDGFDRIRQGIAPFVGATASVAGTKGLVPAPSVADRLNVLRGDGTYVALPTGAAWGAITGTLSAQADLQTALSAKLSVVSTGGTNLNGWVKYSDGTIKQWGVVSVPGTSTTSPTAFSFNTPFATAVRSFGFTPNQSIRSASAEANNIGFAESISQFRIASGQATANVNFNWWAEGV